MSSCIDCAAAAERPWPFFMAGCTGCRCRMFSRSPLFGDAKCTGFQSAVYRQMLVAGGVTHADVLESAAADYLQCHGKADSKPVAALSAGGTCPPAGKPLKSP